MFTKEIIAKLLHRWDHHDVDDAKTKTVDYGVCTVDVVETTNEEISGDAFAVIKVAANGKEQYFRIPGYEASRGAGYTNWYFQELRSRTVSGNYSK